MKSFFKVLFMMMVLVGATHASDIAPDNCSAMTEPCAPIDLCAEACDPIAD